MYHLLQPPSPLDSISTSIHQMKSKAALHEQTETNPSVEMDRSWTERARGMSVVRAQQLTFSMVDIYFMPVKASVADFTPIATRSEPDSPQPTTAKLVSQSAAKPSATIARVRAKDKSSNTIVSNSFRDSGPAAPGNHDNHVAGGANLSKKSTPSFGTQITLVSRKSRHPAKSGQSHGAKNAMDQCSTISEFASYLQTQSRDAEAKDKKHKPIFRGLIMYYVAKDPGRKISHSTKRRMEIVCGLSLPILASNSWGLSLALRIIGQGCWYF
jgi:hypothetical protein